MDIAKDQYGSGSLENLLRSTHSNVSHPGGMPSVVLSAEQILMISLISAAYEKSARTMVNTRKTE